MGVESSCKNVTSVKGVVLAPIGFALDTRHIHASIGRRLSRAQAALS